MSKLKTALFASAIASTSILGIGATTLATTSEPQDDFASKIATRFNLSKEEVKKFLNEEHQAREQEREKRMSETLQKKVDDGTITAEQKQKLEAKLKELHEVRKKEKEQNQGSRPSREEMKAKHDTQKAELEKWASENGIDLEKVLPRIGEGRKHGPHME